MLITSQSDWKPYHCFLGSGPTPKAGVAQMRGRWAGTRDASGDFQEDGGAQHIRLC